MVVSDPANHKTFAVTNKQDSVPRRPQCRVVWQADSQGYAPLAPFSPQSSTDRNHRHRKTTIRLYAGRSPKSPLLSRSVVAGSVGV